jgi:hypothetical protein
MDAPGSTEPPAVSAPPSPNGGVWQAVFRDCHVRGSGIVGFICIMGAIWGPAALKEKFDATADAAGTYLFAAAASKPKR